MLVPITDIILEDRSREEYGDVEPLARSFLEIGQLSPIIVEKKGDKFKLHAGGRRWTAMSWLNVMKMANADEELVAGIEESGIDPSMIEVKLLDSLTPLESAQLEFEENDKRLNPKWQEQANLVRKFHDLAIEEHGKEWTQKDTAKSLSISTSLASKYLQLTGDHPAAQTPAVQGARTSQVAQKQFKIAREKHLKEQRALKEQEREMKVSKKKKGAGSDFEGVAEAMLHYGDAQDWIEGIPDSRLDFFHWDPPYGGREGAGGAFASGEAIDIDTSYCLALMEEMIPEIRRVLHDGAWLAIWYTPVHYEWLRMNLQGHRFGKDGVCAHCGRNRNVRKDYIFMAESYTCRKSPNRFWVNPYPNFWRKTDRHADGHEIQRFLRKDTEPFLYAAKWDERSPTLLRSDHGNVFDFPLPVDRRHVNHKPKDLIAEILMDISVPGAIGGDAGVGSGSSIEAAFETGRKMLGAEIREGYYDTSKQVTIELLKEKGYGVKTKIADWL